MAINDPIGDLITRIRNGQNVRLATVQSPSSRLRKDLLNVLTEEGYIAGFDETEVRKGVSELTIKLRYHQGQPVIQRIRRASKPGLRQYSSVGKLPKIDNGLGVAIVTTSKGVMTDHQARQHNVSGEILCTVS